MKTLIIGLTFLMATSFTNHPPKAKTEIQYQVDLLSTTLVNNNYEWVWKVANPYPGNGRDGTTLQDLSHWSLVLGSCVTQSDLVSAAYSTDGIHWISISANIAVDPSQTCYTQSVMKFNYGLNDYEPTYFKLIVNKNFSRGFIPAVFKSGRYTGCYISNVEGISCQPDVVRE